MGIHQETHPEPVEGCFVCKASTVSVAPSAMPSRNGGAGAAETNARGAGWARDMAAYKTLRAQGLQPPQIDGSARLEHATDKFEVEAGHVFTSPEARREVRAQLTLAAEYESELRTAGSDA